VLKLPTAVWARVNSFVLREEWLAYGPEPGSYEALHPTVGDLAPVVKESVKTSNTSLEQLIAKLPRAGTVYSGSREMTKWMEDGLYKVSQKTQAEFPGKLYNGLFAIQFAIWRDSLARLREDLSLVKTAYRRCERQVPEDMYFLAWIEARHLRGQLRLPPYLGERRQARDKPGSLFVARLWRSLLDRGKST
jgi:hypothetical protein